MYFSKLLELETKQSFGTRPKVFLPGIRLPIIIIGSQLFVLNCSLDGYSHNHFTHVFHFRLDGASFCSGCDKKKSMFPKFYPRLVWMRLVSRSDRALLSKYFLSFQVKLSTPIGSRLNGSSHM
jgi:hypothetical protein